MFKNLSKEINAVFTIAYRDITKLLRDPQRLVFTFIFPVLFIGVLGNSLQSNVGESLPFNFLAFTFTGVIAQVVFQSTASGIVSLVADRENDFAQEMFIAPISRFSIVIGKILGETIVSSFQAIGVILFGILLGVEITGFQVLVLIPAILVSAFFGGAFGVLVMANLKDQKSVNQVFPLIFFPQLFLAGVFTPIRELPIALFVLSRVAPLTYAVDFTRNLFYFGTEEAEFVVLNPILVNIAVITIMFLVFLSIGTYLFVRNERNK